MAHRIFEHDRQQGLSEAWHSLTEIRENLTLEDNWLTTWDIMPMPLFYADGADSGFCHLACTDKPEVKIGNPYNPGTFKPISNRGFLGLVAASIGGAGHKIVSVGSVRNRGRVFLSIELQGREQFEAAGRKFSAFLNFGNGHDKSSVLWVNTSNVCTVCDNTFSANLFTVEERAGGSQTRETDDINTMLRHTKNATLKFPGLADLIDKALGVQAQFATAMASFAEVPVQDSRPIFAGFLGRKLSDKEVEKGLSTRARNTVDRLEQLFETGKGNSGENLADVFSAVTDYYSHESSRGDDKMKQVLSSEYGAGNTAKQEFYALAVGREESGTEWDEMVERGEKLLAVAV